MKSPFSLQQEWHLFWNRIPSNAEVMDYIQCDSPREQKALFALSRIGIIGRRQLFHLFSIDKKRLKKMVKERKVVRHEMRLENKIIPIYALGQSGAIITKLTTYEPNYWVEYKLEDVLKRLLFFSMYRFFAQSNIIPTPEPFVGAIEFKGSPLYIYVLRGDTTDLTMYLKWQNHTFNGRMIIIAEKLNHIQPILMHTKDIKLRITTDHDLIHGGNLQELFYFIDSSGEFIKEAK